MDAKRWAEAEENTQAKAASQQGKADKATHKLANTAENTSTKPTIEQKPVAKQYPESDKKSEVGKKPEVDKKTKNQPASKLQGNKGTSSSSKKQAAGKADSDKKKSQTMPRSAPFKRMRAIAISAGMRLLVISIEMPEPPVRMRISSMQRLPVS